MTGITRRVAFAALLPVLFVGVAPPAAAQATRTWVSGVGDDANPCSRTAPCKTFAGAISKTAAGGEINCLDPGGFGGVTIVKSIAIVCDNVEAGALVAATHGITVNAGAADSVFLSGLDIHGSGNGLKGVRYLAGGALHIHNSTIHKFQGASGAGISFSPSTAGNLVVSNTTVLNNGSGATGGGIEIIPTGNANSKVVLQNVRIEGNASAGLRFNMSGTTGGSVSVVMEDSHIVGGQSGINVNATTGTALLTVVRSEIANNFGTGISANGNTAIVRVSDSTITGNQGGLAASNGATLASYSDNRLESNPPSGALNNGTFTGTVTKK